MEDEVPAVETSEGEITFHRTGAVTSCLLDRWQADAGREPHRHLRRCPDRMRTGEVMDVGTARVERTLESGKS